MESQRKTEYLQVRVTPAQKRRIGRFAKRAGLGVSAWILAQVLPARSVEFQRIARVIARGGDPSLALAELNDFLSALGRGHFVGAVAHPPDTALTPLLANQVAAMVEFAAGRLGLPAPEWTRSIPPLSAPCFASELMALRLHLLVSSPPEFRRRNLFVDASIGDRV